MLPANPQLKDLLEARTHDLASLQASHDEAARFLLACLADVRDKGRDDRGAASGRGGEGGSRPGSSGGGGEQAAEGEREGAEAVQAGGAGAAAAVAVEGPGVSVTGEGGVCAWEWDFGGGEVIGPGLLGEGSLVAMGVRGPTGPRGLGAGCTERHHSPKQAFMHHSLLVHTHLLLRCTTTACCTS